MILINQKMPSKKQFLYSNRGKIFPDKIKPGAEICNQYDFIESIYNVHSFDCDLTYFSSLEKIGEDIELHRFYKLQGNNPANSEVINQRFYDKRFRLVNLLN